jgi:hypothetical protein
MINVHLPIYHYYYYENYHHHPLSSLHSSLAGSQESTGLTDQAFLIHCSTKNILTMRNVLSINAFALERKELEGD